MGSPPSPRTARDNPLEGTCLWVRDQGNWGFFLPMRNAARLSKYFFLCFQLKALWLLSALQPLIELQHWTRSTRTYLQRLYVLSVLCMCICIKQL